MIPCEVEQRHKPQRWGLRSLPFHSLGPTTGLFRLRYPTPLSPQAMQRCAFLLIMFIDKCLPHFLNPFGCGGICSSLNTPLPYIRLSIPGHYGSTHILQYYLLISTSILHAYLFYLISIAFSSIHHRHAEGCGIPLGFGRRRLTDFTFTTVNEIDIYNLVLGASLGTLTVKYGYIDIGATAEQPLSSDPSLSSHAPQFNDT